MRIVRPILIWLVICLSWSNLLLPALATPPEQPTQQQLSSEITRLKEMITRIDISADEVKFLQSPMNRAAESILNGQINLTLFRLHELRPLCLAWQYKSGKKEIEAKGLEAFDQEWQDMGKRLPAAATRLAGKPSDKRPNVILACVESLTGQVQPYYQSGRLYGESSTIGDGLFYIGLAEMNLESASFFQDLPLTTNAAVPAARPLDDEIAALSSELVKAYRQKDPDKEGLFIRGNSSLKIAEQLNNGKKYRGALLQYLEACRMAGLIAAPAEKDLKLTELLKQSAEWQARLTGKDIDHSVGLIFWEVAQEALRHSQEQQSTSELPRAAAIFDKVLPAYLQYVNRRN